MRRAAEPWAGGRKRGWDNVTHRIASLFFIHIEDSKKEQRRGMRHMKREGRARNAEQARRRPWSPEDGGGAAVMLCKA